jgi:biopolymer transport protein ExbD
VQFRSHKRKRAPSVIIVSLIDVLLVVLIFLMVTTAFKDTPAFKINLPETSKSAAHGATENPPVIVTITTNKPVFYLGRLPATRDRLKQEFIARVKENPKVVVAIRADDQAAYGNVIKVTEAAQAAQVMEIRTFLKPGIKPE